MDEFRREWMVRMIERDNRMTDVNIMRTLTRSSQFFASTTMLVLGALIALTGYVQQTLDVVSGLPFTMKASARLLEVKIMLLVVIFTYAFFKFSWAMRQLGQASTLVGAAPPKPADNPEQYAPWINRIARITSYAGTNFNNGLRAYYFGLAALAWFLHPVAHDRRDRVGDLRALQPRVQVEDAAGDAGRGQLADAADVRAARRTRS